MKQKNVKLRAGHLGRCRLEDLPEEIEPVARLALCQYYEHCPQRDKECTDDVTCRIKSFYSRYGKDYLQMNIGSRL
jgi:hypothetical protein